MAVSRPALRASEGSVPIHVPRALPTQPVCGGRELGTAAS